MYILLSKRACPCIHTDTHTYNPQRSPKPRRPPSASPHTRTSPSALAHTLCSSPQAICVMGRLRRPSTATLFGICVYEFVTTTLSLARVFHTHICMHVCICKHTHTDLHEHVSDNSCVCAKCSYTWWEHTHERAYTWWDSIQIKEHTHERAYTCLIIYLRLISQATCRCSCRQSHICTHRNSCST